MASGSVDPVAIEAEIDHIRTLGLDALCARWRSMFGAVPPTALSKDIIVRMIADRLQEQAFGGLDRATITRLDGLARGATRATEVKRRLKPGTVLVREYQGERHTVTVVPDGFVWRGTTFGSLSTIARAITGTAWGGPRFFGLRGPKSRGEEGRAPDKPAVKKQRQGGRVCAPRRSRTTRPSEVPT